MQVHDAVVQAVPNANVLVIRAGSRVDGEDASRFLIRTFWDSSPAPASSSYSTDEVSQERTRISERIANPTHVCGTWKPKVIATPVS